MVTRTLCLVLIGWWALAGPIPFDSVSISQAATQSEPARFHLLTEYGGEAVLDAQTGLIWEQAPHAAATLWYRAKTDCGVKVVGGRRGWRLPSFFELMTLVEPSPAGRTGAPLLPPGHPFRQLSVGAYWSSDTPKHDPIRAYVVDFLIGDVAMQVKTTKAGLWCVRGGPARSAVPLPPHQLIRWRLSFAGPVSSSSFTE